MLRNVFVYKIQCELSCPKSARKVSGLSRNACIRVSYFRYFCTVYDNVEKADLSKGYENLKRKMWLTTHFSEILSLNLERKCHTFFVFLSFFRTMGA